MLFNYRFNPFTREFEVLESVTDGERFSVLNIFGTEHEAREYILDQQRQIDEIMDKMKKDIGRNSLDKVLKV